MSTVRLRLLWHKQAQFAGYLLAEAQGLGQARGAKLECVPMDFSTGPIDALLRGDCEFCIASPAHLLESAAPEELVMLLAIQQASPLVYPMRASLGDTPRALHDQKIAVWPGGEDLELRWLLRNAGVDPSRVAFVPVQDTVAALRRGETACAQMTIYHELHDFRTWAAPADFHILEPKTYNAALLKDGLIARRDFLLRHPELTQAVIDAVLEGWTIAFRDAAAAIRVCAAARPDMEAAEHAQQLADIRALSLTGAALTHGLGYPDPAHMQRALQALRAVHGHAPALEPAALIDLRFWAAVPGKFRASSW